MSNLFLAVSTGAPRVALSSLQLRFERLLGGDDWLWRQWWETDLRGERRSIRLETSLRPSVTQMNLNMTIVGNVLIYAKPAKANFRSINRWLFNWAWHWLSFKNNESAANYPHLHTLNKMCPELAWMNWTLPILIRLWLKAAFFLKLISQTETWSRESRGFIECPDGQTF